MKAEPAKETAITLLEKITTQYKESKKRKNNPGFNYTSVLPQIRAHLKAGNSIFGEYQPMFLKLEQDLNRIVDRVRDRKEEMVKHTINQLFTEIDSIYEKTQKTQEDHIYSDSVEQLLGLYAKGILYARMREDLAATLRVPAVEQNP